MSFLRLTAHRWWIYWSKQRQSINSIRVVMHWSSWIPINMLFILNPIKQLDRSVNDDLGITNWFESEVLLLVPVNNCQLPQVNGKYFVHLSFCSIDQHLFANLGSSTISLLPKEATRPTSTSPSSKPKSQPFEVISIFLLISVLLISTFYWLSPLIRLLFVFKWICRMDKKFFYVSIQRCPCTKSKNKFVNRRNMPIRVAFLSLYHKNSINHYSWVYP